MDQPDSVAVQNSREPARRSDQPAPLSSRRVLLAHSNVGHMLDWHERRRQSALRLGYNIKFLSMSEYHPYTIFPYLEKKWRRRDPALMGLYDVLGRQIDDCDIFIHFNGALIHPEFLEQFRQVKIYHCADDPDASDVISKPVARHYDMCAVANPSCLQMYRDWGCEHVFFWPLGAYHFRDNWTDEAAAGAPVARDVPLIFIGSKLGVTGTSIFDRLSRNYRKRRFMQHLERRFPELLAYGLGWANGRIGDDEIPQLYRRSRIGVNVHNSLGPLNGRLYDLAAFGVCQICDCKSHLSAVFEEGREIVGYETSRECVELIRYYLAHPDEAHAIGMRGRERFARDYSMDAIWRTFFGNIERVLAARGQLASNH